MKAEGVGVLLVRLCIRASRTTKSARVILRAGLKLPASSPWMISRLARYSISALAHWWPPRSGKVLAVAGRLAKIKVNTKMSESVFFMIGTSFLVIL